MVTYEYVKNGISKVRFPRPNCKDNQNQLETETTFIELLSSLSAIAKSTFEWTFPKPLRHINKRFLEEILYFNGVACIFRDDVTEEFLALPAIIDGGFDVYGDPVSWYALGYNGEMFNGLNRNNSVLIYNNLDKSDTYQDMYYYAGKLAEISRTMDVLTASQRIGCIIPCEPTEQSTINTLFKQVMNFNIFTLARKKLKDLEIKKLDVNQNQNFILDKFSNLYDWWENQALVHLGVANMPEKRERRIRYEAWMEISEPQIFRNYRLEPRQEAINKLIELFPEAEGTEVRFNAGVLSTSILSILDGLDYTPENTSEIIKKEVEKNE